MPTVKPKWGFTGSGWKQPFRLNKKQRNDIGWQVGKQPPKFFKTLEGIIADFRFNKELANREPRPAEGRAALKVVAHQTEKLHESLASLDAYSKALVDGIRVQYPEFSVDGCRQTLDMLSVAVGWAQRKIANANVTGGTPQTSFEKEALANRVMILFKQFGIATSPQAFDDCLYSILDAAGESCGMESETLTRLRRKAHKKAQKNTR